MVKADEAPPVDDEPPESLDTVLQNDVTAGIGTPNSTMY